MEGKVTVVGRTKILRARAGEITLPKIVGFAFGSGGSNGSTVLSPGETLKNEFLRKAVDGHAFLRCQNWYISNDETVEQFYYIITE